MFATQNTNSTMHSNLKQTTGTKNMILAKQAPQQSTHFIVGGLFDAPISTVSGKDLSSAPITISGVQSLAIKNQHSAVQKTSETPQMFSHCADNTTACCSSCQATEEISSTRAEAPAPMHNQHHEHDKAGIQSSQAKQLEALRAENARLEQQRQSYYRQVSNLQFCLTILHGQGVSQKKALKTEHAALVEKKTALKSALCAARGTVTKFDQIASFWQEFVLEPEEKDQQQRYLAKTTGTATATTTTLRKTNSQVVVGEGPSFSGSCSDFMSQDDSSIMRRSVSDLLLLRNSTAATSDPSDPDRCDRRDRCESAVVDLIPREPMQPMKPKRVEIKVDFSKVEPPVETIEAVAAAPAAFIV